LCLRPLAAGCAHGEPDQLPQAAASMRRPVPRTVFNAPLTERRAVASRPIPLADMRRQQRVRGSITTFSWRACTLSLRAWLQRHDAVPDGPLLMQVALSLPDADSITVATVHLRGVSASRCSSTTPCRS